MEPRDSKVRKNSIAASDDGLFMKYGDTEAAPIDWEDIARVSATAFEVGGGVNPIVFRHVTFDLIYGEFIELALDTEGLSEVLEMLGKYMDLLVESPTDAAAALLPGSEARVLATARP